MENDPLSLVQETLLGEAAERAPIGIFVADEDMRYIAVNRHGCEMLGYEREKLLTLSAPDVSAQPLAIVEELFRSMVRNGRLSGQARLVRMDGAEIDVDYIAVRTTVAAMEVYVSFAWTARARGEAA